MKLDPRANVQFRIQAFSFLCTFVPGSEKSTERTFAPVEHSLSKNFRSYETVVVSFHENEYSKNFHSKCPKARPETVYKPYNSLRALIIIH